MTRTLTFTLVLLGPAVGCDDASSDGDAGNSGGDGATDDGSTDSAGGDEEDRFSFFVTSFAALQELSGSPDGFGGDFGGLAGADDVCQRIADGAGYGDRTWRAFLSATNGGPDDGPVDAIDRIGKGPWYDRNQRLIANDVAGLLQQRPGGDPQAVADLSDEYGVPTSIVGNSHDVLTGSGTDGRLSSADPLSTCNDWTNADDVPNNTVMAGHSWPRGNTGTDGAAHWIAAHPVPGCAPGSNLDGTGSGSCVGCAGGYGALYCFAVTP